MIITNLDFLVFQFIARFKNPIDYRGAGNAKYQGRKKTVDNRDICNVEKSPPKNRNQVHDWIKKCHSLPKTWKHF